MKRGVAIVLVAAASTVVGQFPTAATARNLMETSQREPLLPPRVDHVGIRATLLHSGMSAVDVERIMGKPAQVDVADDEDSSVRVLKFPTEPIATTITITEGKLSGVAIDVAGVDDPKLPNFSRAAWLGMSRTAVLQMLGTPAEDHLQDGYGMTVEQMIFERPCLPDVSVFLIDGHVAAKRVGRSFPADILGFALPLAPDPSDDETDDLPDRTKERRIAVGMKESELRAQLGSPKLQVGYTFKGRHAEYTIYETKPGKSFGRFIFIDGVLTDFADGGHTPLRQVLDGR
jgi:outer membrane protein assembly factor BamE (lipoprotein component of BamABCDE complex)